MYSRSRISKWKLRTGSWNLWYKFFYWCFVTVALWDNRYRAWLFEKRYKDLFKPSGFFSWNIKYKTNLKDLPTFDKWNIPYSIFKNCIRFAFESWRRRQIEYRFSDYFSPNLILNKKKVFNFQHNIFQAIRYGRGKKYKINDDVIMNQALNEQS